MNHREHDCANYATGDTLNKAYLEEWLQAGGDSSCSPSEEKKTNTRQRGKMTVKRLSMRMMVTCTIHHAYMWCCVAHVSTVLQEFFSSTVRNTLCGLFQDVKPGDRSTNEKQNCVGKVLTTKTTKKDHHATGVTMVPHKMNKVHGQQCRMKRHAETCAPSLQPSESRAK